MSVSIAKGGNISLSKEEPGLTRILIGLGWDTRSSDGTGDLPSLFAVPTQMSPSGASVAAVRRP